MKISGWIQVQFYSLVGITGGPGWFVLASAGPLQLARQNHCSCSLAESDIFHMSKENKICHCARQSEIFLKHKVLLQWFVFISSLEDHCS